MCVSFRENITNNGCFGKTGEFTYTLSDEELFFGPILIKKGEPLFLEYVMGMRDKARKRLSEIRKGSDKNSCKEEYFERILRGAEKVQKPAGLANTGSLTERKDGWHGQQL